MRVFTALHRFFRSTRLAAALLLVIAALGITSTLIPQGAAYYQRHADQPLVRLVTSLHLHEMFRSPLFLMTAGVFFLNLAVCTVDRVLRRARRGAPMRLGPDLIHTGILILIIAGTLSFLARKEARLGLHEGESVELPRGYRLTLVSFERTTYADGRPKDFVSLVEVRRHGGEPGGSAIRVNSPLKIGNLRVYQDSYRETVKVVLRDENGNLLTVHPGEGFH
ncbi:MAG: cytochrome c biogenesis protein ResB, partial [Spirochaetota bacterium]